MQKKSVKQIIVTGGVGFIGTNVVKALNKLAHNNIVVVDHKISSTQQDYLSQLHYFQYLEKGEFRKKLATNEFSSASAIIHLGACSNTKEYNSDYLHDNNVAYSQDIYNYCVAHNIPFIYASSAAVYGDGKKGYSENANELIPLNPYGLSKYTFDIWVKKQSKKPPQCVGLRFFNVYGPHEEHKQDMASVVFHAYNQINQRGSVKLFKSYKKSYKDGEQKRDFIYVKDVVDIILFFLENPKFNGIYNVGTGRARTFNDLVHAVFKAIGSNPKIKYIPMPKPLRDKYQYYTQADITQLRVTGYTKPFTSLEDGVKTYIQQYLEKITI